MQMGEVARERKLEELKKVTVPSLMGVLVGIFSFLAGDAGGGVLMLALAVLAQKYVFTVIRMRMSGRDWAYISFTTFLWWFIVWTLLLNLS